MARMCEGGWWRSKQGIGAGCADGEGERSFDSAALRSGNRGEAPKEPGALREGRAMYCVYVLTNASRTLYIGVTNDLVRRVEEHRSKTVPGFSRQYNVTELVYYECIEDRDAARARERQLKGWGRAKKMALVESANPSWEDLATRL